MTGLPAGCRLALGLDSSTQSLTALVIDPTTREIVARDSLVFDEELPHWGTSHGQLPSDDPTLGHAPPAMWAEALDRLLARMVREEVPLDRVAAVSVSGQQHGSVYLGEAAARGLARLDPTRALAEQVAPWLSRPTSPIWTDSSTGPECAQIRDALGGCASAARLTGSDLFERFTGPQIRRFASREPERWQATRHVTLVSGFLTALLAGRVVPLDHGDASGMSLMELRTRRWSDRAVRATASGLLHRLPPLVHPDTVVGRSAPWLVHRHGFDPSCRVVAGTGDNPSTLVGLGMAQAGEVAVSLGTSDTCFGLMDRLRVDEAGQAHVFVAPSGRPMLLLCTRNGSLAREAVRDRYDLDWEGFSAALRTAPPGNQGRLLLPWFAPEIVPRLAEPVVRRLGGLDESDAAANCRGVVEAQFLSLHEHTRALMAESTSLTEWRPRRLLATGGASTNPAIVQVIADIFATPVEVLDVSDGAALGAALRAVHATDRHRGFAPSWAESVSGFTDRTSARFEPIPDAAAVYEPLRALFRTALADL